MLWCNAARTRAHLTPCAQGAQTGLRCASVLMPLEMLLLLLVRRLRPRVEGARCGVKPRAHACALNTGGNGGSAGAPAANVAYVAAGALRAAQIRV